jgi:hypothetical protein
MSSDGNSSPSGSNSPIPNSNSLSNANSNASFNTTSTTSNSNANSNTTSTTSNSNPQFANLTLDERIDISGAVITNKQGTDTSGNEATHTTFNTTELPDVDVTVNANLVGVVEGYYDNVTDASGATNLVLEQIKDYASQIQCSDFQGKGTIDDYAILFNAASKIANDVTQTQLSVQVDGFNEFGVAADQLSALFTSFIQKLETVSIIDDLCFLQSIASALAKIVNLSNIFGKFKNTILATATVQVPKSSHDATLLVQNVMSEVGCAMTYINHFVSPLPSVPASANLSDIEKNIIDKAVATIDNWSTLCSQGVTISMSNNPDMQYLSTANSQLHLNASKLANNTSTLRAKLRAFNVLQ